MPAVISCTQALGAPRYPSLKGIMAARQREIAVKSLADLGVDDGAALAGPWATKVIVADPPPARAKGRVVKAPAADAAREIVDFLADRRLI